MSRRPKKFQKVRREKKTVSLPPLPPELLGRITETSPYLQPLTRQTSRAYRERYPLRWTSITEAYADLMKMMSKKQAPEIISILESHPGFLSQLAKMVPPLSDWQMEMFPEAADKTLLDQLFIDAYEYSTLDVALTILAKSKWLVNPQVVVNLMKVHSWKKNKGIIRYILKYGPENYHWELYQVTENLPQFILDTTQYDEYDEMLEAPEAWPGEFLTRLTVAIMYEILQTDEIEKPILSRWETYLQDILINWEVLKKLMIEDISAYIPDDEIPEFIKKSIEPFYQLINETLTMVKQRKKE